MDFTTRGGEKGPCFLWLGALMMALGLGGCAAEEGAEVAPKVESAAGDAYQDVRVVSLGGAVTESLYALGLGGQIVATDTSSIYPEATGQLAKVGYVRSVSAEGIIAQKPTRIVASSDLGPEGIGEQLKALGLTVDMLTAERSVQGAQTRLKKLGEIFGQAEKAKALVEKMDQQLAKTAAQVAQVKTQPKILFIYARGAANLLVAGQGTGPEEMIKLAGGQNAIAEFGGFRPLTPEAVLAAKPEVVLMANRGLESVGGTVNIWKTLGIPEGALKTTPRLITMDDALLLGFGPRTGEAVAELFKRLHNEKPGATP